MNQGERRKYLITELLKENKAYRNVSMPSDEEEQKQLLRALMNMRMPAPISDVFLKIQDEYLKERVREKGIVGLSDITQVKEGIYLWQGDITRLGIDAVVNAANGKMTGCYHPNHNCIDNCIHTYAGVQLRLACAEQMAEQGLEEPAGRAKITPAFNLPCQYILHTVGPIVQGKVSDRDCALLSSCYWSCLELAEKNRVEAIAFCCISTGVFCFPNDKAAEIAVRTVEKFRRQRESRMAVVFNVFKKLDWKIYRKLLG